MVGSRRNCSRCCLQHHTIVDCIGIEIGSGRIVGDCMPFESEGARRADTGVDNPTNSSQTTKIALEEAAESGRPHTVLCRAVIPKCSHRHCHKAYILQHPALQAVGRAGHQGIVHHPQHRNSAFAGEMGRSRKEVEEDNRCDERSWSCFVDSMLDRSDSVPWSRTRAGESEVAHFRSE